MENYFYTLNSFSYVQSEVVDNKFAGADVTHVDRRLNDKDMHVGGIND